MDSEQTYDSYNFYLLTWILFQTVSSDAENQHFKVRKNYTHLPSIYSTEVTPILRSWNGVWHRVLLQNVLGWLAEDGIFILHFMLIANLWTHLRVWYWTYITLLDFLKYWVIL